jgi:hypothetical protein
MYAQSSISNPTSAIGLRLPLRLRRALLQTLSSTLSPCAVSFDNWVIFKA